MPSTSRTVLFDRVAYFVQDETAPNKRQRLTAVKGDVIPPEGYTLLDGEAKRLDGLGATGTEEQLLAAQAASSPITVPTSSAGLRLMTVDDLATYMATASESDQEQVSTWMEELLQEKAADADNLRARTGSGAKAPSTATPGATVTDDELAGMKAADTVAYLSQHPDEVDRIEAANEAREKPYATVTDAIEKTRGELESNQD